MATIKYKYKHQGRNIITGVGVPDMVSSDGDMYTNIESIPYTEWDYSTSDGWILRGGVFTTTLSTSSWSVSPNANGFYYYTISNSKVNVNDWINGVFSNLNYAEVQTSQILPSITTSDGSFIIESVNKPTTNLDFTYKIN